MATIPFVGGNYIDRSLNLDCQISQNLFPAVDRLRNVTCLYGVPGLVEFWQHEELILNGGFDLTSAEWHRTGDVLMVDWSTTNYHTGPQGGVLKFNSSGHTGYAYQEIVGLILGETYRAKAYIKGDNLLTGEFRMGIGTQLFVPDGSIAFSNGSWVKLEGTLVWDGVSSDFFIGVYVTSGNNASRWCFIDDISMKLGVAY